MKQNQNILILGANSDIAQALAYKFASEGHHIMLAARNSSQLAHAISDLKIRYSVNAFALEFDAVNFQSHKEFYESLPLVPDVVISVFGYLGNQALAFENFSEAHQIMDVNYTGAVSILNIAAAEMCKKGTGSIIGISSVAGDRGRQSNFIYGSAKAAFTAYLSGLRNYAFHHGVHVLTVKPGFVETKMTAGLPLNPKLTAKPAQVAHDVYKAWAKKKNSIYTLWFWKYIMLIIRTIPEGVFKKLKM
jgi:short-subunit dehydrogenase